MLVALRELGEGFKGMVEIKQKNGMKNENIMKIMSQRGLAGEGVFRWVDTHFITKGVMQTPPRRWEGGFAS